jgi:hypothetical protein
LIDNLTGVVVLPVDEVVLVVAVVLVVDVVAVEAVVPPPPPPPPPQAIRRAHRITKRIGARRDIFFMMLD